MEMTEKLHPMMKAQIMMKNVVLHKELEEMRQFGIQG